MTATAAQLQTSASLFPIGRKTRTASVKVTLADILKFAHEYDPQPMHTDPQAAKDHFFGELIGSGWHTLSLTMRLMAHSAFIQERPFIGVEVTNIRFHRPMRPDDDLYAEAEVVASWPCPDKPGRTYLRLEVVTFNQHTKPVVSQHWMVLLPEGPLAR